MSRRISLLGIVILAAIFMATAALRTFVVVQFSLDRERIAKELCQERDVETSCCKGSCVLKDRLSNLEQHDTESPAREASEVPEHILMLPQAPPHLHIKAEVHYRSKVSRFIQGKPCSGFAHLNERPPWC